MTDRYKRYHIDTSPAAHRASQPNRFGVRINRRQLAHATEQQAIDAPLGSLAAEDDRFRSRPDLIWSARGGSHTNGGAFQFTGERRGDGQSTLSCTDKFGNPIRLQVDAAPPHRGAFRPLADIKAIDFQRPVLEIYSELRTRLPGWSYERLGAFLDRLQGAPLAWQKKIELLLLLIDRRFVCGDLRLSFLRSMIDRQLNELFLLASEIDDLAYLAVDQAPQHVDPEEVLVLNAGGMDPEGEHSLSARIVSAVKDGWRQLIIFNCAGQPFIGSGLGPDSHGVRIEVYGSAGDYLGSGIDGLELHLHGQGQDQLAQIMKSGRLVVHGDVGQTFMYAAKGCTVLVRGNAAGRPLINAVGRLRVIINGTCLDYLAESFMAGDPLQGGGFVVLSGLRYSEAGELEELETP